MTSGHLIFIPAILVIGMFIGFLFGSRVAQDRLNLELKRQAERDAAKTARAERAAERKASRAKEADAKEE